MKKICTFFYDVFVVIFAVGCIGYFIRPKERKYDNFIRNTMEK